MGDVLRTPGGTLFSLGRIAALVVLSHLVSTWWPSSAWAASHYETELRYYEGRYEECLETARLEVRRGVWNELWPAMLIRCLLDTGRYEEAQAEYESSLTRYADRIAYRLLGAEVFRRVNQPDRAERELAEIFALVRRSPWRYGSSRDQVTLGRFFAEQGEDGRQILEMIYDPVREKNPKYPEVYLATAELALEKHDDELAAKQLAMAAELQPSNPQIFYLLARAWQDRDGAKAAAALSQALELNPRHVPSLLLQVDQLIDAEEYELAEDNLTEVLTINLREPKAWAYHAVIAHLSGHYQGEELLRQAALSDWSTNHEVDYLIGLKLSQKYRFREGVTHQRQSLAYRPTYLPAKFQLAYDLLRLGNDQEGWALADEVQQQDNYHVVAYNLATLRQQLEQFETLESDHFVVRMEAREAAIYGAQVVELLEEAFRVLTPKYEVQLEGPVQVEIFPRQEDFAIRTFGLPGGAGYLGVCFGRLITANSPASQGTTPTNWESVLWHEFCHVVTLQKTQNRMPRWLSEGISVYEERQRDSAWGQHLTPRFRQMILGDELTPVSQLSGAFLRPESPVHLQLAYYESALVVEYLIERVGLDGLRRILVDLSIGMPVEESLTRYIGAMSAVDTEFAEYARRGASEVAESLNWSPHADAAELTAAELAARLSQQPDNYWLLLESARRAVQAGDWAVAQTPLETIRTAYPADTATLRLLAEVCAARADSAGEQRALETLIEADADALDALARLAERAKDRGDWDAVERYARKMRAVNPLLTSTQQLLAEAAQKLEHDVELIAAQSALLQMDPIDPAMAHYMLAVAHNRLGQSELAKRHVLMALEEAPRYRKAQQLLLRLVDPPPDETNSGGSE